MTGSTGGGASVTATFEGVPGETPRPSFELPPRWRLARQLGRGGQATVWLAHDTALDQWVAVKVFAPDLDPVQRERLRREVTLGRTLTHPGIVRIFELLDLGDRLAVVMEWAAGGNLGEQLRDGPLPVHNVVSAADQVLAALEHLHRHQVVHRDVKPSNLLVDEVGRVRLGDLGLARSVEATELTRTTVIPGTPAYMSPEQIRGERPTPAIDLYAFGATMYHLLSGRPPYSGEGDVSAVERHLRAPVPDVRGLRPDCPRWLARFVRRLLAKRPGDRWRDAGAARRAFARRRVLLSPGAVCRGAAIVLAVAAAGGVGVALVVRERAPATVAASGRDVVARAADGSELWTYAAPSTPYSIVVDDFLGEGHAQVAVGFNHGAECPPATCPGATIVDAKGRVRGELDLDQLFGAWFPEHAPVGTRTSLHSADVDGDGRPDLVWRATLGSLYPAMVGVWAPTGPDHLVPRLANSGHLLALDVADLDGDGRRELVVTGINNPLGFQAVVVVLPAEPGGVSCSPDRLDHAVYSGTSDLPAYALLGPFAGTLDVAHAGRDGIALRSGEQEIRLDASGNPEGSPLFGLGPEPRRSFWGRVRQRCQEVEAGLAPPEEALALLTGNDGPLAEEPTRVATTLLAARSVMRAGNPKLAVALLEREARDHRAYDDLILRLGEYRLLEGEGTAGRSDLVGLIRGFRPGRGGGEARSLLLLDAALTGDETLLEQVLAMSATLGGAGDRAAVEGPARARWAFCRGEWTHPALDSAEPTALSPDLDLLRVWTTLERGRAPAEVAAEARRLAANPEVVELAGALEAWCLVRTGQPARALALARQALSGLERDARWRFESYVWLGLAHRVAGEAAVAAGDPTLAQTHLDKAHELAPATWFGAAP